MDQHQRELRRAAAEAFFESLDKLQETLCTDDQPIQVAPEANKEVSKSDHESSSETSLESLEQAVADIEQFMQAKEQEG